jgi:uncharacterized protein (TIGR02284 family)
MAATTVLNELLRNELSAVETFAQALLKLDNEPEAAVIRRLASEHSQAATWLREQVTQLGGVPASAADSWAFWTQTVKGTSNLLGDAIACKALQEGEEHGLREYEEALSDPDLSADSRLLIRFTLIPQQHDHVEAMGRLIASIQAADNQR